MMPVRTLEMWTEDEIIIEMLKTKQERKWSIAEQAAYFSKYAGLQSGCLLGLFPNGRGNPTVNQPAAHLAEVEPWVGVMFKEK